MGNKHSRENTLSNKEQGKWLKFIINMLLVLLTRNHFEFLYVIGRGGFGKVWNVKFKKYNYDYAMKEMLKAKVIEKNSVRSVRYERELLSKMKHPFIINMHYAFQDSSNLYLVMDLLNGGDLRYHISRCKKFNEEQTSKTLLILIYQ
jgi:serine/threonine protein kinase